MIEFEKCSSSESLARIVYLGISAYMRKRDPKPVDDFGKQFFKGVAAFETFAKHLEHGRRLQSEPSKVLVMQGRKFGCSSNCHI